MPSIYKNIPNIQGIEIEAATPEITVSKTDNIYSIGLDTEFLTVDKASALVNVFIAGETLSALIPVYQSNNTVIKGSSVNISTANIIGITITSSIAGTPVSVLQYGILTDNSFNFAPTDLLFLSPTGIITTVAPDIGYLTRIGKAITSKSMLVFIEPPKTL